MKLGRKSVLVATIAALAMFVFGPQAAAHEDPAHPHEHAACTWTVDKTASLNGTAITSLELVLGQTVTVDYQVVVTRDCEAGFTFGTEGASGRVVDSYAGQLGPNHLFFGNTALHVSETFRYSRNVTATSCDAFDVENTVEVLDTDPEKPFATDSLTIHVNVACDGGCTLTQGYWKTHSEFGPAPYDNTWAELPLGASTTFFLSGKTWFQVFWTPPAGGNAYYQLAHQYMAARLNILSGASAPTGVTNAIASSTSLFTSYTPTQIGALKGNNSLRKQFLSLAETLGSYNEGAIGPGHCD